MATTFDLAREVREARGAGAAAGLTALAVFRALVRFGGVAFLAARAPSFGALTL
jgi:hypothetical protein